MKITLTIEKSPWQYEEKEMDLSPGVATVLLAAFQEKNWARKIFAQNKVDSKVSAIDPVSGIKYTFTLTNDLVKAFNAGEYSLGMNYNNSKNLHEALTKKATKPFSYLKYYKGIQQFVNELDNTDKETSPNKSLFKIKSSLANNPHTTFALSDSPVSKEQEFSNEDLQVKVKPSIN